MNVRIQGMGWSGSWKAGYQDTAIVDLVLAATQRCLADASRAMMEVEAVVTASVDLWDGKTASNIAVTEVVGAVMKPETRIAGDGLLALIHAAMTILAGQYRRVLVVAHGKASECDQELLSRWTFDPVYQQPLGATAAIALGLQAHAAVRRYPEVIGHENARAEIVSAITHAEAQEQALSPEVTPQEVLDSPIHVYPLHQLEIAVSGDGACAFLLEASEEEGVYLSGFGYDLEAHYLGDRDLSRCRGLQQAAQRAYRMAHIDKPLHEIERAYWSLYSSVQLPLWAEAAGLWQIEDGIAALLPDQQNPRSQRPGMYSGWSNLPPFVGGLHRLFCAVRDLRRQAARTIVVHGCHGAAGQLQTVCVCRKR